MDSVHSKACLDRDMKSHVQVIMFAYNFITPGNPHFIEVFI